MLPDQLLAYLKTCKDQGYTFDQLEPLLKSSGWDELIVASAKAWYAGDVTGAYTKERPSIADIEKPKGLIFNSKTGEKINTFNDNAPQIRNRTVVQHRPSVLLKIIKVMLTVILIFALIIGAGGLVVSVAYGNITLPDHKIQTTIRQYVLSLPFMPKTPEYVATHTLLAHQNVEKLNIDAQASITAKGLEQIAGVNQLEMKIKGPVDYSNPQRPALALNVVYGNDFDIDTIFRNNQTYIKINKITNPWGTTLTGYAWNNNFEGQFKNKWIYVESKSDGEGSGESNRNKLTSDEMGEKILQIFENKKYKQNITMVDETYEALSTYKIHVNANREMIDDIEKMFSTNMASSSAKLSDVVHNLSFDFWIDKNNYYVRKMDVSFVFQFIHPDPVKMSSAELAMAESMAMNVRLVVKLSDFGKTVDIVVPPEPVNLSDMLKTVPVRR